ncbi:helix-turn-helix transcriptional regulator [Donghicola sp. C2-DW-16]|uniref:Helix-turn-helix transcriptional regulator n=1 Tax=Donghicola mangrovi TaxID=2729614 RepID=A0ABX2PET5_9RHOB|nr:helix-turn-helix transcriptional regulator [Donghicola mangrovi]NVO27969.1 helix-turn-helix transcriptional regulator [Donghicola mangrovi]
MAFSSRISRRKAAGLLILMTAQVFCAVFFVTDVISDYQEVGVDAVAHTHLYIETLATLSLVLAILFEGNVLAKMLRRQAHLEASLNNARAAVQDIMDEQFEKWGLTPSEQDIATFLVKGFSTAEIAELRGSAEGTVKTHLNSIYRKSGSRNRTEVLSLLLDCIMVTGDKSVPTQA